MDIIIQDVIFYFREIIVYSVWPEQLYQIDRSIQWLDLFFRVQIVLCYDNTFLKFHCNPIENEQYLSTS